VKKTICYLVLFLLLPIGSLTTAIIRRGPTHQSKTALEWFDWMQMDPKSPNLIALQKIDNGNTVKEVTELVGYTHASTFTREFTKHWGCCPKHQVRLLKVKRVQNVA